MFDIGFSELILLMVVILLVVGPERLPRVARTAGLYLGRARRMIATVKADVARELAADELKRTLQQQAESTGIHDIIEETRDAATAAEQLFKPDAQAALKPAQPAETTAIEPAAPDQGAKHGGE
jgi:sec-independent protein translocase protein TatB